MVDRPLTEPLFDSPWKEVPRLCQELPGASVDAVLRFESAPGERWLTATLRKQIPIAALVLASRPDSEDPSLVESLSRLLAEWLVETPIEAAAEAVEGFPAGPLRARVGRELIGILLEHDPATPEERRLRPVLALMQLAPFELVEDIVSLLSHEDPFVRGHAALVLGFWKVDSAMPRLMELFERDADEDVPARAAKALGALGSEAALPKMIEALKDLDSEGAMNVIDGLLAYESPEALDALLTALEKDWSLRLGLEVALGAMPDLSTVRTPDRVKKLERGLESRSEDRRAEAATLLGALRAAETVGALSRLASGDKSWLVRTSACTALGEIGAAEAVPVLIERLADRVDTVRREAAAALGKLQAADAVEPLLKLLTRRRRSEVEAQDRAAAATALGAIGRSEATDSLVKALRDEQPEVRIAAAEALGKLKAEPARRPLGSALKDADSDVAHAAARALGALGARETAPAIARLLSLGERTPAAMDAVLESLWRLSFAPRSPAQECEPREDFDGLLDTSFRVAVERGRELLDRQGATTEARSNWLRELASYQRGDARSWITDTLEKQVPLAAALAGSADAAWVVDALVAWVGDRGPFLAGEVIDAIPPGELRELLGQKLAEAYLSADEGTRPALFAAIVAARTGSAWTVLASAGPKSDVHRILIELDPDHPDTAKAVMARLRSRTGATRLEAVHSLARLTGGDVENALLRSLKDSSKKVRAAAGAILASRGDGRGMKHVRVVLRDLDLYSPAEVFPDDLTASPTLIEGLLSFLESEDWTLPDRALEALGLLRANEAVPALLERLEDSEWAFRQSAIKALGSIGDPRAVPLLREALGGSDAWERKNVIDALAEIGDASVVPDLAAALDDADEEVKAAALRALSILGSTAWVEETVERLLRDAVSEQSWQVAKAAIEALALVRNRGDRSVTETLVAALGSPHFAEAARALAAAGDESAAEALAAVAGGRARASREAMEALWSISESLDTQER